MQKTSSIEEPTLMSLDDVHSYLEEDKSSDSKTLDRLSNIDEVLTVLNEGKANV